MKLIIAGSRNFYNYEFLKLKVGAFIGGRNDIEIVSGGAMGADWLGERYAVEKGYKVTRFAADWNKYGKAAVPIRNAQMADYADACIVFWDGESIGTKSMINLAKAKGLEILVELIVP